MKRAAGAGLAVAAVVIASAGSVAAAFIDRFRHAYDLNGAPLPPRHGGPARILARVEVSADGATWMLAETRTSASAAWTPWSLVCTACASR